MSQSKAIRRKSASSSSSSSGGGGVGGGAGVGVSTGEGKLTSGWSEIQSNPWKLWTPNEDWDKDELGDVIYWFRQVLGLSCGLIWGLIPLTGGVWLMAFLAMNVGLVVMYYSRVLRIDEEEFGGHMPLIQEGLMPSTGLFLLCWILLYSTLHSP